MPIERGHQETVVHSEVLSYTLVLRFDVTEIVACYAR
jgi:hypothetical protein